MRIIKSNSWLPTAPPQIQTLWEWCPNTSWTPIGSVPWPQGSLFQGLTTLWWRTPNPFLQVCSPASHPSVCIYIQGFSLSWGGTVIQCSYFVTCSLFLRESLLMVVSNYGTRWDNNGSPYCFAADSSQTLGVWDGNEFVFIKIKAELGHMCWRCYIRSPVCNHPSTLIKSQLTNKVSCVTWTWLRKIRNEPVSFIRSYNKGRKRAF